MLELKFKTRGASSPSGKPRVYFASHPDDAHLFDEISNEILKKQNCVIFYCNDEIVDNEDLKMHLSQMQLFVVPITETFLTTSSRAYEVDFKYAKENNIPILPLMYGVGLESLFNQKCGDIQFLDKFKIDPTAISYDVKLENFLSSVLVSDELAQKVRTCFDAYVFLSYRKKDRKHAQEVMKSIHSNKLFRDIAIWYDEFLIPGENFNDAIKAALTKSDIFALVVTPNLINETNYVMTTEYPMAKKENKAIVPIKSVTTDENVLKEKYEGIPNCIDVYNYNHISEEFIAKLKDIALATNDSPEHNFYIGLAYLNGIDVEVDYNKAKEILTLSARKGCILAMEKLAEAYNLGYFGRTNKEKQFAMIWQEKVLDFYRNNQEHENIFDKLDINNLKLGKLYSQNNYPIEKVENCYNKSLEIRLKRYQEKEVSSSQKLAEIYNEYGLLYQNNSNLDKAILFFTKAIEIIENENNVDDCIPIGLYYLNLGKVCEEANKFVDAIEYYKKGVIFFEKSAFIDLDSMLKLKNTYCRLGKLHLDNSEYEKAKEYFYLSIKIANSMIEQDVNYYSELAMCYLYLIEFYSLSNKQEEVKTMCEKFFEYFWYYIMREEASNELIKHSMLALALTMYLGGDKGMFNYNYTVHSLKEGKFIDLLANWYSYKLDFKQVKWCENFKTAIKKKNENKYIMEFIRKIIISKDILSFNADEEYKRVKEIDYTNDDFIVNKLSYNLNNLKEERETFSLDVLSNNFLNYLKIVLKRAKLHEKYNELDEAKKAYLDLLNEASKLNEYDQDIDLHNYAKIAYFVGLFFSKNNDIEKAKSLVSESINIENKLIERCKREFIPLDDFLDKIYDELVDDYFKCNKKTKTYYEKLDVRFKEFAENNELTVTMYKRFLKVYERELEEIRR